MKKEKNKLIFFDSFNLGITGEEIDKVMINHKIEKNRRPVQDLNSSFCGFYCIAFVLYMYDKNMTLTKFMNMFKKKKIKN